MRVATFRSQKEAFIARETVDKMHGYPRPGVNVGDGKHATPPQGDTQHYCEMRETKTGWELSIDEETYVKLYSKI